MGPHDFRIEKYNQQIQNIKYDISGGGQNLINIHFFRVKITDGVDGIETMWG